MNSGTDRTLLESAIAGSAVLHVTALFQIRKQLHSSEIQNPFARRVLAAAFVLADSGLLETSVNNVLILAKQLCISQGDDDFLKLVKLVEFGVIHGTPLQRVINEWTQTHRRALYVEAFSKLFSRIQFRPRGDIQAPAIPADERRIS
jgi:hypothetical protein